MKEPKKIPLTDHPRNKEPQKIPLSPSRHYDIDMTDDLWIKDNENNLENNSQSVQSLETM